MFTKTIVATALLAAFAAPLAANAGEVQHRLNHEQRRINQGVRNGSLTYREYNSTERREDRLQAERNRALRRDGGTLTAAQRARLNRQENGLSRQIYFDKHDRAHQH